MPVTYVGIGQLSRVLFPLQIVERAFAMINETILSVPLDESTDQKREKIFVAAGFLGREECWKDVERQWIERLKQDNLEYFRTTECKSLRGQFFNFRSTSKFPKPLGRQAANKVRDDLENIILSSHLIGFALGIVMPEYLEVLRTVRAAKLFYQEDPHVEAFYGLMYQITRIARRKAKGHSVAFVYDQSTYSERIEHAFKALKVNHPTVGKSMVTFAPMDDRKHPPLQAADLLASIIKDAFERWLDDGRESKLIPLDAKWNGNVDFVGKFDKEYMMYTIVKNVQSKRFAEGLLPTRLVKK